MLATVGLVMRDDQLIVDIAAANRALELMPQYSHVNMPEDMLGLIEQYEYGLKYRIYEVVNWLVAENLLSGSNRPSYVHPVDSVDIMAPDSVSEQAHERGRELLHPCLRRLHRRGISSSPPRASGKPRRSLPVSEAHPWSHHR